MRDIGEIAMVLTRIRNCYRNIQLLTLDCISENVPEQIPVLLRNREEIMHLIAFEEQKILDESFTEEPLRSLRKEIESVIASIVIADSQLGTVIKGNLDSISNAMGRLYHKSRAVSAYANHSRV